MARTLNHVIENSAINVTVTYKSENGVEEYKIYKEVLLFEVLEMKIRNARKEKNISYQEIGKIINTSEEKLALIETDIGKVDIDTLNRVLDVLDLEMKISVEINP